MKLASTIKRKPKTRTVNRSFRIPPEVDRALAVEARRKGWTKTWLIRNIIHAHVTYQKTLQAVPADLNTEIAGDEG